MEISKSTPYVRYRENISSTLHKGTIHIESEYLDRERKTTIESIEGQTWQNMVNGENKEEDILPRLGLKIEGNENILDTVEQHMPIDTIIGDVEPVANEDGTYTYEISTMEGSYAKTLDGENNFSLTSDSLVGDMYIKYNAQGEEVNGNIVMNNGQSSYTIENSNDGEIKSAILSGSTKYRDIDTGDILDTFDETKNLELVSVKMPGLTTTGKNIIDGQFKPGMLNGNITTFPWFIDGDLGSATRAYLDNPLNLISGKKYTVSCINPNYIFAVHEKELGSTTLKNDSGWIINKPYTFTATNNCYALYVRKNNDSVIKTQDELKEIYNSIMIEEGETATSYEPHQSNILTVNEPVELRGIGEVQDTLDCLTGELTQRIGEIVLNGSEDWQLNIDIGTFRRFTLPISDLKYDTNKYVIDNIPYDSSDEPNFHYKIDGRGKILFVYLEKAKLISDSVKGCKDYFSKRNSVLRYELATPTIKTVDLTIKNQDNKIIQSLHTHPSTTHINLSSDGLIPNAEINYTMYSNIGETTGEQITDGTDSKLIEGKIYGDTLLNVLPSPSLKNSMDYNTSMQKLNNGYDNINVADVEFKELTLYGQTMVNIEGIKSVENPTIIITNSPMRFGKGGRK